MAIQSSSLIEIKQTARKGRGVFARTFIAAGTEFERVPVLVMPAEEVLNAEEDTVLSHYVFDWGKGTIALALGFGSVYNHSYTPNARYDDYARMTKVFTALKDIQPGEEITINYNGHQDDLTPVWFDVVEDDTPKKPSKKLTKSATAKTSKTKRRTLAT